MGSKVSVNSDEFHPTIFLRDGFGCSRDAIVLYSQTVAHRSSFELPLFLSPTVISPLPPSLSLSRSLFHARPLSSFWPTTPPVARNNENGGPQDYYWLIVLFH